MNKDKQDKSFEEQDTFNQVVKKMLNTPLPKKKKKNDKQKPA
ncbi:MAG: hypothetical protein N0C81_14855 [Candidatus Thiodiazotropha lotti]|nr:hypothetical protein [Candidatus Thiodiazotropha lotti]MCW4196497.1 hypothetical protein [Candidatus Thiodiazotropha lotti]MCW4201047.1 hypothetical protein [Candidatus Thiodiazotropha lotti]